MSPPAAVGVAALIAQREQELAQLRMDSLQSLERQARPNVWQAPEVTGTIHPCWLLHAHVAAMGCALPTPRFSAGTLGSCALFMQVEQKDSALRSLEARLAGIQADFEYNLSLLEGRDAELATAEAALAAAGAELAAKLQLIDQMQDALAEAEKGMALLAGSGLLSACSLSLPALWGVGLPCPGCPGLSCGHACLVA